MSLSDIIERNRIKADPWLDSLNPRMTGFDIYKSNHIRHGHTIVSTDLATGRTAIFIGTLLPQSVRSIISSQRKRRNR